MVQAMVYRAELLMDVVAVLQGWKVRSGFQE
jgi:hypothetical protein